MDKIPLHPVELLDGDWITFRSDSVVGFTNDYFTTVAVATNRRLAVCASVSSRSSASSW
jgi:hypothetical protein